MAHLDSNKIEAIDSFQIGAQVQNCESEPAITTYDEVERKTSHPLMDYSACIPSLDQQEINNWLARKTVTNKSILHIGIGSSSIAKMFPEAHLIDGFTIAKGEINYANSLGLPNYGVFLINKYSKPFLELVSAKKYDIIVDNNLASFACCQEHFLNFMAALKLCLAKGGIILTHWLGMQWILDHGVNDTEECWRLNEEKLTYIADFYSLDVRREGDVFILRHAE